MQVQVTPNAHLLFTYLPLLFFQRKKNKGKKKKNMKSKQESTLLDTLVQNETLKTARYDPILFFLIFITQRYGPLYLPTKHQIKWEITNNNNKKPAYPSTTQ